jgi:KDO2-lipid IV(A) lauroyltransferase
MARGNLAQIAGHLAAEGRGPARVRAAATDPGALERLVRAVFRHAVRDYLEILRGIGGGIADLPGRVVNDTPDETAAAFATAGPAVFVTLHLGSMMAVGSILAREARTPFTAPMEAIADPELQRLLRRGREQTGVRTVDLAVARRELRAALDRGEGVAIVGDRDVTGAGHAVELFGLPARLPIGPALAAVEAGAPVHVAATLRRGGGYRGWLVTLPHPPAELPRRARIEALLAAEARAFEDLISAGPEQWVAVFHPIWADVDPLPRSAAARPAGRPDREVPA